MKMKKNKIVMSIVAVSLAVVMVSSLWMTREQSAEAATRLYGVQQIVDQMNDGDPLVVLELVPDEGYSSLGYYVSGSEPGIDPKLLQEYTSRAERYSAVRSYLKNISGQDNPINYSENNVYIEQVSAPEDAEDWQVLTFAEGYYEAREGYFTEAAEGETADYTATVVTDSSTDTDTDADVDTDTNTDVDAETDTDADTGTAVAADTDTDADAGTDADADADTDTDADADADADADTDADTDTTEYVYTYTPGEGTHKWVDDTSAESVYDLYFEKLYYKVNVTSNDWFSKYVLEQDKNENVVVISLTPKQLETNISAGYIAELPEEYVTEDVDGDTATEEETNNKLTEWNSIDLLYISNSSSLNYSEEDLAKLETYKHLNEEQQFETELTLLADGLITIDEQLNDITWETAYNIYEHVLNTSMPVIVDDSLIPTDKLLDELLDEGENHLLLLVLLLKDYISTATPESYTTKDAADVETVVDLTEYSDELFTAVLESLENKDYGTMGSVQGSVYFNKDHLFETESTEDDSIIADDIFADANIVNQNFNEMFYNISLEAVDQDNIDETKITGMNAVIKEIDNDNFYNELHEVDYTTEYNAKDNRIEIAQSTLVKYILNYAYRRASVYKDSITVLDIEPTKYSTLTESKIREWLKDADSERIKEIKIVQTTTSEFIGKLVDLNEEYDMIYIGSCIGPNQSEGAMYQSEGKTKYNDQTMNGLIYSHIGDSYTVVEKLGGLFKSEREDGDFKKNISGTVETRFSGNDITKEKMNDLKAFVDAGYPVVISDKFYDGTKIDTTYVDNSSYLYEFMNGSIEEKNVMNDDLNESSLLATYLNMSKLYLSMVTVPTEYKVTYQDNNKNLIDSIDYLTDANGKYSLDYTFELADNSEAKIDTIAYEVKLFIDTDADGRYDASEELDGLQVRNVENGEEVDCDELETGVRYTVTRQLPDGYVGMIPWKLLVSQVSKEATTVHDSEIGYTAVPSDEVTKINVLQIAANGYSLDLSTNSKFKQLFKNVEDKMNYEINIQTVTVEEYLQNYNQYTKPSGDTSEKYESFYNTYFQYNGEPYDMLILGFKDMYDDITSEGATKAIKLFIESGRSVLFSHDTTSFVNANQSTYTAGDYWGYYLNQYIRSTVGMDRYGITEDGLSFLKNDTKGSWDTSADVDTTNTSTKDTYKSLITAANKDIAYNPKQAQKTANEKVHGYSNISLLQVAANDKSQKDIYYTNSTTRVNSVTQTNKGQITSYPFDLNSTSVEGSRKAAGNNGGYQMKELETLNVATTHCQYYQLDMQLDKTSDNESDIVVWYCLGDGMYDAMPNDVRNNYYIYSVGNVMYTGMGHYESKDALENLTWGEAQLFVNTIMASYNAGKKDPTIAIVESEEDKGTIQQYAYRTYDIDMDMVDSDPQEVYFYVNDNNIINGTKTIKVQYYVEAETEAAGTEMMALDDSTINLVPIAGDKIEAEKTVDSNKVYKAVLNADWVNKLLASKTDGSLTIYIGAQTTLDYDYDREDETTGEVFTSITIKRREMFDLD